MLASVWHSAMMPTPWMGWAFSGVGGLVEEWVIAVLERRDKVPEGSGLIDVAKIWCHCGSLYCVM